MGNRWIELIEDDVTLRLSSNRFATLFVVFILAIMEIILVNAGVKCQATWKPGQDCFGPVQQLADTMALLAAGVYALARMKGVVEAWGSNPPVAINQPNASQTNFTTNPAVVTAQEPSNETNA